MKNHFGFQIIIALLVFTIASLSTAGELEDTRTLISHPDTILLSTNSTNSRMPVPVATILPTSATVPFGTPTQTANMDEHIPLQLLNRPAPTTDINWNYTWDDIAKGGAVPVTFKNGASFLVKLIFIRGEYNAKKNTFQIIPCFQFVKINTNNTYTFYKPAKFMMGFFDSETTFVYWDSIEYLRVRSNYKELSINLEYSDENDRPVVEERTHISYDYLLKIWADNAKQYCATYLGKKACATPQIYWEDVWYYYYILGKESPLEADTERPFDAVRLVHVENSEAIFKERSFSLPMSWTFNRRSNNIYTLSGMNAWDVSTAWFDDMNGY